jgi:hypothetical protein
MRRTIGGILYTISRSALTVDTSGTIKSAENIQRIVVDDGDMAIAGGWCVVTIQTSPCARREMECMKIVDSMKTIVSTEHHKVISPNGAGV